MCICFCLTKHIILWRAHVFLAWYSPWHCVLYLFLGFLAKNWDEDVSIWDYFGFSHALHILPAVFRNSFWLRRKHFFNCFSKTFLVIFVGFVIIKNVHIRESFARYIVPVLDGSKYFYDYICQVALEACPSLVYSNNDIKSAQTGGGFSFLQLLSLTIV